MQRSARDYYKSLAACVEGIQSTLADGQAVSLPEAIARASAWVAEARKARRKIMFVGNGASAAISSHMAADFCKNVGVRAMAFNDSALLTAVANDEGYEHVFERPVGAFADAGDLLFAISSSGASANILLAARAARDAGCRLVTLSGFAGGNPLRGAGDLNFYVPSGAYGCVEVAHHWICHCIVDALLQAGLQAEEATGDA